MSYAKIGADIGELVEVKQKAYGDSFGKSGGIMRILYPDGIPPEKMDDALTIVRVVDKLFRIATKKDAFGESPWRDIAGYSLLAIERQERKDEDPPQLNDDSGGCDSCDECEHEKCPADLRDECLYDLRKAVCGGESDEYGEAAFQAGRRKHSSDVAEFHELFGIVGAECPTILPDADIRRRLVLSLEEAFELVEACCADGRTPWSSDTWQQAIRSLWMTLKDNFIMKMPISVNLPKVVDALADIDYVSAGFAHELGVDMIPVADEVHRANKSKMGGPRDPVTGKIQKPEGFIGPDIEDELRKQGWMG